MSTFGGQSMQNTSSKQAIQRIIRSWSRTLELEQARGESIVTQSDLDRLTGVLSHRFDSNHFDDSATRVLDSTDTSILHTQILDTRQ